jgi:hypothetical protein
MRQIAWRSAEPNRGYLLHDELHLRCYVGHADLVTDRRAGV